MRKNIKGLLAGSLGLLALQLPGMTVFAQAADRKSPAGKCITEYSPWYGNGIRYADRNCADHLLFQGHSCNPGKFAKKAEPTAEAPKTVPVVAAPVQETDDLELVALSQPRSQQVRMYR